MAEEQGAPTEQQNAPSDVQIMEQFVNVPLEKPRDEQGRFAKSEQPAETAEQPAEPEQEEKEQTAEEYKWDDLKSLKVKVPMKVGEKEWEDEVTLEDLRAGRILRADYTRKTQEIAEERRQFEAQTRQAISNERQQYMTALNTLSQSIQQAAAPELANVDWTRLANESPADYVRLQNRAREVGEAMNKIRFEQEKLTQQQTQEREAALVKAVGESRQKLHEAIPDWNDATYQAVLKRAVETYGFAPNEVGQIWDHRFIQVLHDANQFRQLKEKTPEKQLAEAPKLLRPGQKPQVPQKGQQADFVNAQERLRKSGSLEDAVDVFGAMLGTRRR